MAENNWDEGVANLSALASQFGAIQKKALRAVGDGIKVRLVAATPERVSEEQGGNSLPAGGLKAAVRSRVSQSSVAVDFGKQNTVANSVDSGHRAPGARVLAKSGRTPTGKPTPAHPFVRNVQDASAAEAQATYEEVMTAEFNRVLSGG